MITIDTSVAIKWSIEEPGHREALFAIEASEGIAAPDLLMVELVNVFRKKRRSGEMTAGQAERGIEATRRAIRRFVPAGPLAIDAFRCAQSLDHAAHDCFFLVCALREGPLLTADRVFAEKCRNAGYDSAVVTLADVARDGRAALDRVRAAFAPLSK